MTPREFFDAYDGWEFQRENDLRTLGLAVGNVVAAHFRRRYRRRVIRGMVKTFASIITGDEKKARTVNLMAVQNEEEKKRLFREHQKKLKASVMEREQLGGDHAEYS